MPTKNGFMLTADDLEYLRTIYHLRVATINHLAALSLRSGQPRSYTRTQKRTAKLAARGYLATLTRPPRKTLYSLAKEGIETLVEIGYAPEDIRDRRPREKELKDLFLDHLMMVKDVQVKLMMFVRDTSIRIDRWSEGPEIYDSVSLPEQHREKTVAVRMPIRPDALFVLRDVSRSEGKNTVSFVLEADRSTESHDRIRSKIKGYIGYAQQSLALEKWRLKSQYFRVLIVTRTTARADNLRCNLLSLIPAELRHHYLFTDIEALRLENLLS